MKPTRRNISDLLPRSVITNEFWGLPLFVALFAVTFTLWVFLISISQQLGANILPFAMVFTFLSAIFWIIDPLLKERLPLHAANIVLVAIYLISSQVLLFVSGGFHSPFFLVYYFVVLTAAMAYGLTGAVGVTALIAVAYIDFVEDPIQYPEYGLKMIVLWIVALMIGFLAETKRRVEKREMTQSLRLAALAEIAEFMRELSTPRDVVDAGLEAIVRLLGARSASLRDEAGHAIARHGSDHEPGAEAARIALWESWPPPEDEAARAERIAFGDSLLIDRPMRPLAADEHKLVRLLMDKVQLIWIHLQDKAARDRERREKERVFDSIGSAVLGVDSSGVVRSANRRAYEILGSTSHGVAGRSLPELGILLPPLAEMDGSPREITLAGASGRKAAVEARVVPRYGDERAVDGWIVVMDDLEEIRRLENQIRRSEALAAVGELAARVAHEIRNPLGGIIGFLGLAEKKSEPEVQGLLREARSGIDRLDRIVRDLLTFARPTPRTDDAFPMHEAWASLARFEAEALGEAPGPEIQVEPLPVSLENARLKGDSVLFAQVLSNLVRNAREAAGAAGRVTLRARPGDPHAWIEVDDTGPGWPKDAEDKLFEPFYSRGKTDGSGLGLAIARRIVEEMGGLIRAHRVPVEEGWTITRFRVAWPLQPSQVEEAANDPGTARDRGRVR